MDGLVSVEVERYLDSLTHAQHDDPVLDEMEQRARRSDFPIVGRSVGRFLEQQARAIGARRVLELGSGFGYSAYWFARAGAEVICTDRRPEHREEAARFLGHADLWDAIDFRVGDAADVLASVDGPFDIVFCDADKAGYPRYFTTARDKIRVGGLWICDNTLWHGKVLDAHPDADTRGVLEHNDAVMQDRRFVSSLVPLRDGVLVALRVA